MAGLQVGGGRQAWLDAGFDCTAFGFQVGPLVVSVEPGGPAPGIWMDPGDPALDGAGRPGRASPGELPRDHPNGACGVDHVVVATPHLERSVAAFASEGLSPRRTREAETAEGPVTQAFYVAGPCLIELVGRRAPNASGPGPAILWGVTFLSEDLGRLPALDPPVVASIRGAVQPGRRIAVARPELELPIAVAFMDPRDDRSRE